MTGPKQPTPAEAEAYLAQLESALQAVRKDLLPPMETVAWPPGLDRAVLSELRLPTRIWNCLRGARLTNGQFQLSVLALMSIPNFGRGSLADLLLTVEKYLIDRMASNKTIDHPRDPSERWRIAEDCLVPLLATSADIIGISTLADALRPELMRLACRMGLDSTLREIELHEATLGIPSVPALVVRRLRETLNSLDEKQHKIVQARLIQSPPAALQKVGNLIGVTRERVRQIQVKLESKIEAALGTELHVVAFTLQERLDPVTSAIELKRRIEQITSDADETVASLFHSALIKAMNLTQKGEWYTTDLAEQVIRDVHNKAKELADDVGLVQEWDLVRSLPDDKWRQFWPRLSRRIGLYSFYGSFALRDSSKARAKAALISLGRPATRDEIGAVCGQEPNRVGANLSNISSVVKADRDRWGLYHWVEDEYDGIVGEIVQRIEEDGGVTTTERLLREIPSKFNVSSNSVRAYMYTSRFEIRNGSISLANPASIRLRDFDDAIEGRDEKGAPFWTFVVEDRYLEGYSVVGLPPEFAQALGCAPDSNVNVKIINLPDCRALSVNWRLASLTGASLGHLAKPIRQLGLRAGDRVRVTIAGSRAVELGFHDGSSMTSVSAVAEATLERILRRRRAF